MTHNDLIVRPITGREELELFCRLPYVLNDELADDLDAGRRRPEWMWVALRGERLVARLAWWAPRPDAPPAMLDTFDLDDARPVAGAARRRRHGCSAPPWRRSLPAGARPPEYIRYIPPDWREDEAARQVVEDRMTVLDRGGAKPLVERLRFEWRPGAPVPGPSGRLSFRPVGDRAELVELMTLVLEGTLDAHSRADLTRMTAAQAAAEQYDDELAHYRSPRDWWRIATLPGGDPVGFVIPARNSYNPIIAYIGVLPAYRGQGLHRRPARRGHADPRRPGRAAHPGGHGRRQRADGPRLPPRRIHALPG